MAIGMKLGRTKANDKDAVAKVYSKCQEFWNRFEKKFGSNLCYDIIGAHLDNEEERKKWLASGGMEKCSEVVEKTAQMLCEHMKKV